MGPGTHTKRVLFPTYSSVKFLPFKEASNGPFSNFDFEVVRHEKGSNEVQAKTV